ELPRLRKELLMSRAESTTPRGHGNDLCAHPGDERHAALRRAYGLADLPRLIETVADLEPERVALSGPGATVGYAELSTEIGTLAVAMGGALAPDALISVVVSGRLPHLV